MTYFRPLVLTTAALALAGGTPAQALTPAGVWTLMKDRLTAMGQTVSVGSQDSAGDRLILRNITSLAKRPDGTVAYAVPELDLQGAKDGTVTMTMSPSIYAAFSNTSPTGTTTKGNVKLTQHGLRTDISGTPGDLTYTTAVPQIDVAVNNLTVAGQDMPLDVTGTIRDISSTIHLRTTDATEITSTSGAASAKMTVDGALRSKGGESKIHVDFAMQDLSSRARATVPQGVNMQDVAAALNAGYAANSHFSYGPTTYTVTLDGGLFSGKIEGKAAGGSAHVTMDRHHLQYSAHGKESSQVITSPLLPMPELSWSMKDSVLNFLMPVEQAKTPQPLGLVVKLDGLTLGKGFWQMVDPKAMLPHDPANVVLDLAGKGSWNFNILDPAQQINAPKIPGQIDELTLNKLKVEAVGTKLMGTGSLKIDNSDPAVPRPDGTINLTLTGAIGLLDKLKAMGLLPQQKDMVARMMLGLFTVPGGAPDTVTSQIQFNPDGSILANGQPIH